MRIPRSLCRAGSAFLVCSALGCSQPKQAQPPQLPAPNAQAEYSPDWPELGHDEDRFITFELGDSFETCRRVSPKFPFDSAHARAQDRAQLRAFASCMNDPAMADRTILLVGRADDRGAVGYNRELGLKRAQRIKELLMGNGLSAARIQVRSAGDSGAQGENGDSSYGYDRRVDVIVNGGVHAPGVQKS
ncbi:MAG TPA: OmpA family protein [Polyangiaceae bacterium]